MGRFNSSLNGFQIAGVSNAGTTRGVYDHIT